MKITTNVNAANISLVMDMIVTNIGNEPLGNDFSVTDQINKWVDYQLKTPADEKISTKRVFSPKGSVVLTFNDNTQNVKVQVKKLSIPRAELDSAGLNPWANPCNIQPH